MRSVIDKDQFTPFGLWIRQYCKGSHELVVTNLDYIFNNYKRKKILLIEEKQNGGVAHKAQSFTFQIVDTALADAAANQGYDYWGFYLLQLPYGASMPGPGMKLNGKIITGEQLLDHLNFKEKFCGGYRWDGVKWSIKNG